jgi:hypothetical protein
VAEVYNLRPPPRTGITAQFAPHAPESGAYKAPPQEIGPIVAEVYNLRPPAPTGITAHVAPHAPESGA